MWDLLGAVDGSVLLLAATLLAACLFLGRWLAYNPMTEGDSVMRTVSTLRPYPCEVAGCKGMRSARHLVCPSCWKRVPKHLRADVYRTWDQFQLRQPEGYLRWLAARQKCLESLQ